MRRRPSIGRRDSGLLQRLALQLLVEPKLLLQVFVEVSIADTGAKPPQQVGHGESCQADSRTCWMAPIRRVNSARSDSRVFHTRRCERVVAGTAVVLGRTPFAAHIRIEQQTLQRWVERAFADDQDVVRDLPEALRDAIAVHGLTPQDSQDQ